ncbi:hypothetical protein Tco_1217882 [Tanacetum coccineum]
METKDTLSSYSNSKEQQMQQMLKRAKILKDSCLNGLSALQTNFTRKHEQGIIKSEFEHVFSHIFGEDVDTFTRTFSQNIDTLEQQLTKETILESNCHNAFRVPKTQFEKIFTSVLIKPSSLDVQEVKASDSISEDKAQERCMVSFRQLHSHLKLLSNNDLKGTRIEYGFKRVFATLFIQDLETFTGTMFLNMDQLEKQLDKEEFQEIGSIAAFKYWRIVSDKSIDERAKHKQEYNNWVNERQMQTTEDKVDSSKALDASLVIQNSRQQHTKQPEFNNEGEVDQNAEQCHDTCPLPATLTDNQITELSNQSLESENIRLKKTVAQFQKDFLIMEAHCVNLELKYQNQALKEGHMLKNDMVHNHYPEEAKKKTQESSRNSRPSVMPSARSQSTANGSKPKPRINNQKSRNWPASKSSCVTTKTVPIAEHSRNSRSFSDSKHFVCSTCQKCVFNANHDSCVTKFLNEVNSRAKVPSNKTTNRNKPVEQISVAKKPERQIPKGHRFSIKKTSVVHEKTITPRSGP